MPQHSQTSHLLPENPEKYVNRVLIKYYNRVDALRTIIIFHYPYIKITFFHSTNSKKS